MLGSAGRDVVFSRSFNLRSICVKNPVAESTRGVLLSAQAIAKGEADPKTYRVHVPAHLDVGAIRTKLKMSENAFAARFGILPSTLRDWEQNRRHPDGAARVLLMVIDKEPDAVTRALAPADLLPPPPNKSPLRRSAKRAAA